MVVRKLFILLFSLKIFSLGQGAPIKRSDDVGTLEPVIQQLLNDVTQLQSQLSAVKSQNSALESRIHTLEAKESQHVAFTATISAQNIPTSPNAIIAFDHVVTNTGGHYDPHISAFRAPYDGDYQFLVTVDVSGDYNYLTVRKSGHVMLVGGNDGHTSTQISAGGVISLKAGDTVTVNHPGTGGGFVDGGTESIFSGFRIR